jgi:hypothetical protein
MQFGGWDQGHSCGRVCDGMPWPGDPSWAIKIDDHGCPYWSSRPYDGTKCCGCFERGQPPDDPDAGPCEPPMVWQYRAPGCGVEAKAICGPSWGDACLGTFCGCDGQNEYGCDFVRKPYAHAGACTNIDGGHD